MCIAMVNFWSYNNELGMSTLEDKCKKLGEGIKASVEVVRKYVLG